MEDNSIYSFGFLSILTIQARQHLYLQQIFFVAWIIDYCPTLIISISIFHLVLMMLHCHLLALHSVFFYVM